MRYFYSKKEAGFLETIVVSGAMGIGLLLSVVLLSLNSARAKSRDAKRVADVRQIQAALELYANDTNTYPDALKQLTPTYLGLVPTSPSPADGSCTEEQNTYSYSKIGSSSYKITFCLGGDTGGFSAGLDSMGPSGPDILPVITPELSPGITFDTSNIKPITEPGKITGNDHILGSASAKNTFIVYSDFQCPACAAYNDLLKQIPQTLTDTKLVLRDFPLTQIHKNAAISALAAEAAGAQGKFWEMSDQLFKQQGSWADEADPLDSFASYAKAAGVANIAKFKSDVSSQAYKGKVQSDLREAYALDLPGTPSFYFNGHHLDNGDMDSLKSQAQKYYK